MADSPVSSTSGNSPEYVAFRLLQTIVEAEAKADVESARRGEEEIKIDRKWILDTYAECLRTVRDPAGRRS